MATPYDHYPFDADLSFIWHGLHKLYLTRRCATLQHRIMLTLQSGQRIRRAVQGSSQRAWQHKDRISRLQSWGDEAAELCERGYRVRLRSEQRVSEARLTALSGVIWELFDEYAAARRLLESQ